MVGYPVGGDFEIKYYMVQMHYDNPKQMSSKSLILERLDGSDSVYLHADRRDSSGIRFYIGKERRQHDLGYLTLTADGSTVGIAIPPRTDRFMIDSYCPAIVTKVSGVHPVCLCMRQGRVLSESPFDRNHGDRCIPTHPSTR